jgi:hypothetical protein
MLDFAQKHAPNVETVEQVVSLVLIHDSLIAQQLNGYDIVESLRNSEQER